MRPITIYCAFCWRPVWSQFKKIRHRTETCQRVPIFRYIRLKSQSGDYTGLMINDDGEMRCSVLVLEP
jgi:hypothetical protein